ncbi:MAG: hypothetical protein AB7E81_21335 [Hyphomicrobiaceae bacterium]
MEFPDPHARSGLRAADAWISRHLADLGKRSTLDLDTPVLSLRAQEVATPMMGILGVLTALRQRFVLRRHDRRQVYF